MSTITIANFIDTPVADETDLRQGIRDSLRSARQNVQTELDPANDLAFEL